MSPHGSAKCTFDGANRPYPFSPHCSERTKALSKVWKEVFAAEADRVVVVIQGQMVWPITSSKLLTCRRGARAVLNSMLCICCGLHLLRFAQSCVPSSPLPSSPPPRSKLAVLCFYSCTPAICLQMHCIPISI